MRNSRRVNATLIIAIVGSCLAVLFLPATSSTSARGAIPQEFKGPLFHQQQDSDPLLAQDVEVKRLDDEPDQELDDDQPTLDSLSDTEEDKWALDDDDRMTDEEMNKELFGDDDPKSESELESPKLSSEGDESDSNTDTDNKSDANRKNLAPRQTIESYLKSINSLTINTYTPPSKSREGIDVPQKIVPPMMPAAYRSHQRGYPVTAIRYQTPDIYHNPLYFEDRGAERGGIDHGLLQPIVSAGKFAGDVLTLPKKVRNAHPRSCEYHQNLRYAQPGLIRN